MTEWRTVPAEPTEAMVKAACFAGFGRVEGFPEQFLAEYKAALAAAPAPVALTDEEIAAIAEGIDCEDWMRGHKHFRQQFARALLARTGETK